MVASDPGILPGRWWWCSALQPPNSALQARAPPWSCGRAPRSTLTSTCMRPAAETSTLRQPRRKATGPCTVGPRLKQAVPCGVDQAALVVHSGGAVHVAWHGALARIRVGHGRWVQASGGLLTWLAVWMGRPQCLCSSAHPGSDPMWCSVICASCLQRICAGWRTPTSVSGCTWQMWRYWQSGIAFAACPPTDCGCAIRTMWGLLVCTVPRHMRTDSARYEGWLWGAQPVMPPAAAAGYPPSGSEVPEPEERPSASGSTRARAAQPGCWAWLPPDPQTSSSERPDMQAAMAASRG